MQKFFWPFAIVVLCFDFGCKRSGGFEVPAEVGRGLSEVDSLRALWSWLEGRRSYEAETLRLWTLFELIKAVAPQNPDSAHRLAQRLEGLAQKSAYPAAKGLSELAWGSVYMERAAYDSVLFAAQRALLLLEKAGHKKLTAQVFHSIGVGYYRMGAYDSALAYYGQAISIWEALGNKQGLASSYNNIGTVYHEQGRYAEALEYHQKALVILEAIGDKPRLATSYNNIGNIYTAQGRYFEALESYQKTRSILEAIGDKRSLAIIYNNIGGIYSDQGRYVEALQYHQKALATRKAIGDRPGIAESYNNIGVMYANQGRYIESLEYYLQVLQIGKYIGDQLLLIFAYTNIGNLHLYQGQPHIGRPYLLRALALARKLNAYDRLQEIYLSLSQTDSILAASGQPAYWKTAYQYARLHTAYNDSVVNEESIRKQAQLESQYEHDKKVALLRAQQEKERILAQAEVRRRETERNLSLIIAGLTIIGAGVLWYFLRIIHRQKRELELANQRLEQTNRELEQVNTELRIANQVLEESNRLIEEQTKALLQKNEEILDSIRYAERIQRAILPSEEKWRRLMPDSFRVYLPRDIVAGDFYWVEETKRYIFLGVADATGHGVPGAFVSLVCASALNKAVWEEGLESPAQVLGRAKALVSELLTREGGKLPDGMDIALVRFEKAHPWRLVYAGANRPLWMASSERELIELSPTRQPVGYTFEEKPFEEVAVDLGSRRPVMVYGFTDGIVDQMGGPKGRKLMAKGLRELLLGIADLPCEVQRERIEAFFAEWKGEMRQMDDVTLVGVRVG